MRTLSSLMIVAVLVGREDGVATVSGANGSRRLVLMVPWTELHAGRARMWAVWLQREQTCPSGVFGTCDREHTFSTVRGTRKTRSCFLTFKALDVTFFGGGGGFGIKYESSEVFRAQPRSTCVAFCSQGTWFLSRSMAATFDACLTAVQSAVKDQPLVFHSKVRSSGYASTPR